ncbi:hypothetical protein HDU67_000461 [Dinochytrium kinnereticum]|nr:hypothetical protein HDU67_000461 [Dinochytrium kinnereticum]
MSDVLMDILSGKAGNNRYAFGPQQLVAAWENRKVRDYLLEYPLANPEEESTAEETGSAKGSALYRSASYVNPPIQEAGSRVLTRNPSSEVVGQWLVSVNPGNGEDKSLPQPYEEEPRPWSRSNARPGSAQSAHPANDTDSIHSHGHGEMHFSAPPHVSLNRNSGSLQPPIRGASKPRDSMNGSEIANDVHAREGSVTGSISGGIPARRVPSHATIANSIIESLSRGVPLGNQSSSDEDTRLMDIEFHRLAPQVVKERGASLMKQLVYCHNRSLTQQSRAMGALVLEIFVAMFAGMLMGVSTQGKVKELFNGIYDGIYVLLSPAYLDLVSLYGLLLGISIALAGAPAGVKVFGEEKTVFWREAASGHSKMAYYFGKTLATVYRLILTSLHFTAMYMILARPIISVFEHYALVFLQFWGVYGMSCIVSLIVRRENASLLAVVICLFAAVFCGYGPNLVQAGKWNLLWLFELSFNKWAAEAHYASSLSIYKGIYDIQFSADLFGYSLTQITRDYVFCFILGIASRIIGFLLLILLNREKQR